MLALIMNTYLVIGNKGCQNPLILDAIRDVFLSVLRFVLVIQDPMSHNKELINFEG